MTERLAEIIHKHGARTREGGWAECGLSAETCDGCFLLAALREAQQEKEHYAGMAGHSGSVIAERDALQRRVEALEKCLRDFSLTDVVQWMDEKETILQDEKEAAPIDERKAEIARLRALLDAPSAQMSDGRGNLISVDSTGMRQVIDENARLRARLEAVVRVAEKIWGVIPVTGPGTLGPDVAVPLLAYEELRSALAACRERA